MSTTTVARTLTKLKHFEQNVDSKIAELKIFTLCKDGKCVLSNKDKESAEAESKTAIQGIKDEITAQVKNRLAIMKSNMNVVVNIAGIDMTIAEALLFKQYGIPKIEKLLQKTSKDFNGTRQLLSQHLNQWEAIAKDASGEKLEELKKLFFPILSGPVEELDAISSFVRLFSEELDAALNESNAVTTLEL